MTTSYFKVQGRPFFFDHRIVASASAAWFDALAAARLVTSSERKGRTDEQLVSVWKEPVDPGPWDSAVAIGETSERIGAGIGWAS